VLVGATSGASVDFDVGHSRCAVLMVVAGAHNPIFVPYKTRVRVNHRLTLVTEAFLNLSIRPRQSN